MQEDRSQELALTVHYRSDTGQVRDHNEDYLGYYEPKEPERLAQAGRLYVVADGVGGHQAGEVASRLAVQTVLAAYYRASQDTPGARLRDAYRQANSAVYDQAGGQTGPGRMSTTLVAAVVRGRKLTVANVGDSRAYLVHDGRILQITRDHGVIAQMVAEGVLTPEQAENHPRRHVLNRSIGTHPDVEVDVFTSPFVPGDRLLLCSDGVTEYVNENEILDAMRAADPETTVQQLVDWANTRGGQDNITVLIVQATPERRASPAPVVPPRQAEPPPSRRNRFWPVVALLATLLFACGAGLGAWWFFWFDRVPEADLSVEKIVDTPNPSEGDQIVYTITVTNWGPDEVAEVVVTDTLPSGVTFFRSSATQGVYTDTSGLWDVGSLGDEISATLRITVSINADTAGLTIANEVAATSLEAEDPNLDDNVDIVSITVAQVQSESEITTVTTAHAATPVAPNRHTLTRAPLCRYHLVFSHFSAALFVDRG